jgi:hypothetical protein
MGYQMLALFHAVISLRQPSRSPSRWRISQSVTQCSRSVDRLHVYARAGANGVITCDDTHRGITRLRTMASESDGKRKQRRFDDRRCVASVA